MQWATIWRKAAGKACGNWGGSCLTMAAIISTEVSPSNARLPDSNS
jgi:hypothetical protein